MSYRSSWSVCIQSLAYALLLGATTGCASELSGGLLEANDGVPTSPPNDPALSEEQQEFLDELNSRGKSETVTDLEGRNLPMSELPELAGCDTPGPRIIRRLTTEQYLNTLAGVFGTENLPTIDPLQDIDTRGYNTDADDNLVQGLTAQTLNTAAEQIAESFLADPNRLLQFTRCTDNTEDCQLSFIHGLGLAISREPLSVERANLFLGLFGAERDGLRLSGTFNEGAQMVITAMAQSPYLLYRRELGTPSTDGEVTLTSFEIASELAYFLTNDAPDSLLIQAASDDQLNSPQLIQAQVNRLLEGDKGQQVLAQFVSRWLDIDRLQDKAKADGLPQDLRQAMLRETELLFVDSYNQGGTIGDLFRADYSFLNQQLSDYYEVGNVATEQFERVTLAGTNRTYGLLGQGAFLAEHALVDNSSPVQRAFVVRERLLCNELSDPPNNLDTNLKPGDPTATSRERYAAHSNNPICFSCHQLMDPIGFAFENYDGFGKFRDSEGGQEVDSTGGVPVMVGSDFSRITYPVSGADELTAYLSENESVRACLVDNLSYVAFGLSKTSESREGTLGCLGQSVRQFARQSGNTLRSVVSGIVQAPHFTRRRQDN